MRSTKIVCTIGPACSDRETLRQLVASGMNVARLNFSHGTHASHLEALTTIRSVAEELGKPLAVLVDLCGPRIRVGTLAAGSVQIAPGDEVAIVPTESTDDPNTISCIYPAITEDLQSDDRILIDDGKVGLTVLSVSSDRVTARVDHGQVIKQSKGMNLPGVKVSSPSITDKDRSDIQWAIDNDADWLALSFVRHPDDIVELKQIIAERNGALSVIAKIEKPEAIDHLEAIVQETDGVMVARGDLGIEMEVYQVPMIQKRIIQLCNFLDKPVITATQMLESMTESPSPTRAEVSDVANAIIDGTDAVMLSGETAAGRYPVRAVETMDAIAKSAEPYCYGPGTGPGRRREDAVSSADAVCYGARNIEAQMNIRLIIAFTNSGSTALHMSKARPRSLILAPTVNEQTLRKMCLYYGVIPVPIKPFEDSEQLFRRGQDIALEMGLVQPGQLVIFVAGVPLGVTGGTNMLRVHTVVGAEGHEENQV